MSNKLTISQTYKQKHVLRPKLSYDIEILKATSDELEKRLKEESLANPLLESDFSASNTAFDIYEYEAITSTVSLQDELMYQANTYKGRFDQLVAYYIINNLDEKGYFKIPIAQAQKEMMVSKEVFLDTLRTVQSFSPSGIGGTNLIDSLLIQMRNLNYPPTHLAYQLISDNLSDIANQKWALLQEKYQVSKRQLLDGVELIKSLNPHPCANYNTSTSYKVPDITIACDYDNIIVSVQSFNTKYKLLTYQKTDDKEVNAYYKRKEKELKDLFKSIQKRENTLLKVCMYITQYQQAYFIDHQPLRKLTMQQIADATSLHVSTISRSINNKLVDYNKMYVPLTYFLCNYEYDGISKKEIIKELRGLILQEDPTKPLSDQVLCDLLNQKDYGISRRTIMKYRQQLHYPSSMLRKTQK